MSDEWNITPAIKHVTLTPVTLSVNHEIVHFRVITKINCRALTFYVKSTLYKVGHEREESLCLVYRACFLSTDILMFICEVCKKSNI
jgi:hypothetical protein